MPLVSGKHLLDKAHSGKYAVPHFNINNMEILQAIINAAKKENSPVIIGVSKGAIEYAGIDYIKAMVKVASKEKVEMALHLDHGTDIKTIRLCIKNSFTSIMIDASSFDFEKNVEMTKKVVKLCHPKKISVEAELGKLKGVEDNINVEKGIYADPDEAARFVEETNVDSLAAAIGTSHGAYKFKGEANLRFDILENIARKVKIPLVLHGASGIPSYIIEKANKYGAKIEGAKGVPDEDIKKAISLGICKINIDSDLRLAFVAGVREALAENPGNFDPRKVLGPGKDMIEKVAIDKMRLLGASGKS
jgi:fructose-bisphosphate aldolase, class II